MDKLIRLFTDYLEETLGITTKPETWTGCTSLPVFMQSLYDCHTVFILNEHCLLLVSRGDEASTPATIRKHVALAGKKWHGSVVYVSSALASYDRRRLIQYKVPFVVPGNQLYLPHIGLDMREHFRQIQVGRKAFSPATQVMVLRALLAQDYGPFTSMQLARKLGYTPMTVKRAFDEIEQAQISIIRRRGRERTFCFEYTGRELWDISLPFLRDPVQRRVTAMFPPGAVSYPESGLTALSRYSMIGPPLSPTIAVSAEDWKAAKADPGLHEIDRADEDAYGVEIWRYDPTLLSAEHTVDRLSLFLSLRDSSDERIEAALDEMMESVQW